MSHWGQVLMLFDTCLPIWAFPYIRLSMVYNCDVIKSADLSRNPMMPNVPWIWTTLYKISKSSIPTKWAISCIFCSISDKQWQYEYFLLKNITFEICVYPLIFWIHICAHVSVLYSHYSLFQLSNHPITLSAEIHLKSR